MSMTDTRIASYLEQLHHLATMANADLLKSFLKAGLPSSTYYRAINGTELRYDTATKVASVLRRTIKEQAHVAPGAAPSPQREPAFG